MHALSPPYKSHSEIKATRKMRWWYESLADLMIAQPNMLQQELAAHFGRTPTTISTIINSDAFKAYLRQRRASYTESLDASVRMKMMQVADRGFDLILDRFDKKRDSIPMETLIKVQETALKGLGFGGQQAPSVVVNTGQTNNTVAVSVSLEDLQSAQRALRNAQNAPSPLPAPSQVTDAEYTEVGTPSPDGLDTLA